MCISLRMHVNVYVYVGMCESMHIAGVLTPLFIVR